MSHRSNLLAGQSRALSGGGPPDDATDSSELDTEFAAFEQRVARVSFTPGPPLLRVGQQIAGKYRIDSLLGCGGMGAVFAVTHAWTGRPFAMKWLLPILAGQPDVARRFRREDACLGYDPASECHTGV